MNKGNSKNVPVRAPVQTFKCRHGCPLAFYDKTACLRHEWTKHINFNKREKGTEIVDLTGGDDEMKTTIEIDSSPGSSDLSLTCPGLSSKNTKSGFGEVNKNDEIRKKGHSHKDDDLKDRPNFKEKPHRAKKESFKCKVCDEVLNDEECYGHYVTKHPSFAQTPWNLVESQANLINIGDNRPCDSDSDLDDSVSMRAKRANEKAVTQKDCSGALKLEVNPKTAERTVRKSLPLINSKGNNYQTAGKCDNSALPLNVGTTPVGSRGMGEKSLTSENRSVCKDCGKSYSKSHMKIHARLHNGISYRCEICKKSYQKPRTLRLHMLTHKPEKTCICEICNKAFHHPENLRGHRRRHHTEKTFICEVCNKPFRDQRELTVHQRIHTTEKTFVCEICNKALRDQRELTAHQRVHTTEKTLVCEVCKKAFQKRSNLTAHQRIHTKEKTFVCEVCNRAFRERRDLRSHQRIHIGGKPFDFACDHCSLKFSSYNGRSKHAKKCHTQLLK